MRGSPGPRPTPSLLPEPPAGGACVLQGGTQPRPGCPAEQLRSSAFLLLCPAVALGTCRSAPGPGLPRGGAPGVQPAFPGHDVSPAVLRLVWAARAAWAAWVMVVSHSTEVLGGRRPGPGRGRPGERRPSAAGGEPRRLRLRECGSWSKLAGRGWTRDPDRWPLAHLRPRHPVPRGALGLLSCGSGGSLRRPPSAAPVPPTAVFFLLPRVCPEFFFLFLKRREDRVSAYHSLLMQINLGRNRPAVSLGVFCGNLAAYVEHRFASQAAGQQGRGQQGSSGSGPSAARGSGPSHARPQPPRVEGRLALRNAVPATGCGRPEPSSLPCWV